MDIFNLLFDSPLAGIVFVLMLLVTTSFIPYQVDRPSRGTPHVTYALIGLNCLIFLLTVFMANINLQGDKIRGGTAINNILQENREKVGQPDSLIWQAPPQGNDRAAATMRQMIAQARQEAALQIAAANAKTKEGYEQVWQIQHANASYVLDPHYGILNVFAYRASEDSVFGKLLGLFGSMFLHGSFMHLISNMIFLWTFGRAMEENLGSLLYAGAYLLAGIAATLLYHIITLQFTPNSAAVPLVGASGAIAGVLGFFALRFYRTPVNIFYIQPVTLLGVFIASLIVAGIGGLLLGVLGAIAGFFAVWIGFLLYMRKAAFGTFKLASAWAIGVWLMVFNIVPALMELLSGNEGSGTAYWAHVGGFLFGMAYGLLIGSKAEGGKEYLLEDAQKAYDNGDVTRAIECAQNLLEREPNNGGAYEVLAKSYDRMQEEELALDNYELAIEHLLRKGEREAAVQTYQTALRNHERFILPPDKQLAVGNQMAQNQDWQNSAETLVKIPYTFTDAPEGELALLRASQIYLEQLGQPEMAVQLLDHFAQRYPQSQWMPQVQRTWKIAQFQMLPPEDRPAEAPF
ncbi:MAG: hypothetical protein JWN98_2504 [Abditibacteriota bacterium]|nr:hypothetical protein [Abditibacteriota bacterium]